MAVVRKEALDQFRVSFGELAKARRGTPVQVDPFLIARAVAVVMRECKVRSAAGRPILWNDYRVILARADFEHVRALQGPLERDLSSVLAQEVTASKAELVGELRIAVVFDEADELAAGEAVVRVAFVPTRELLAPRVGELTVRFGGRQVAGEIAARPPGGGENTVFVHDSPSGAGEGGCVLRWPGGEIALAIGTQAMVGRPHPGAPAGFVPLDGAGAKVNKQHFWIAVGPQVVRIGRPAAANPVHVDGQALAAGQAIEVALPAEISLSRGELVVTVRRG